MSKVTRDYNSINWSVYFYLDPSSPSGIRWNTDTDNGYKKGSVAGSVSKPIRWVVGINKSTYMVHRVIWCLLNDNYVDPLLVVDHLDGNPLNNAVTNLTLKTVRGNSENRSMSVNNSTGYTGVRFRIRQDKNGERAYFIAMWKPKAQKQKNKAFSVNKLGYDQAKALAIAYRSEQINLLNAAGASYTERHCGLTPAEPPAISPVQPT